jgi:hypothetical protein
MPAESLPKRVSPSTIARYYFHECERFLRYVATPVGSRLAEGIPKAPFDTSPVTRAILDGGYVWEEEVVGRHLGDSVEIAKADGVQPVRDRIHGVDASRRLISDLRPGRYVYQPTLQVPTSFYEHYGIDPNVVVFSDCRPDLITCFEDENAPRRLRVIDVKASPGLKLSHRIQATLYTIILEHALGNWGVTDRDVAYEPGIWLAGAPNPETFDVRAMRPPLENFLRRDLQSLMEKPAGDARWHLYYRCEWCEWFQDCREEMRRENDVSRLPYLSSHAKRFLGELAPPVESLEELSRLLGTPDAKQLDDCASLSGTQERLAAQTRSLLNATIANYGSASLSMPRAEHIRLIITLQTEPVSGHVCAWGILAQGLKDVFTERIEPMVDVAASDDPREIDRLEREFITHLHSLMRAVHEYNTSFGDDWSARKTLQAYVYDTYEQELLIGLLGRRLLDVNVAAIALELFFYFQEPELLEAEDHPSTEVFFPVVILVQVLRALMALPIEVTYRFADAVRLLPPSQYAFVYREDSLFAFELSNQMKSDAIFQVWKRGRSDLVQAIKRELRARLRATNSLVNGTREAVGDSGALFAWPPKFHLPETLGFRRPLLSRLAFIARYESVLGYLAMRKARMAPDVERLRAGDAIRVVHAGGLRFEIDPMHQDLDITTSGYPEWLLTEHSERGRQAALLYHDFANRDRVWVPRNLPVGLASISQVDSTDEHRNQTLQLGDLRVSPATPSLEVGRAYLLQPRFTDFNTARCVTELQGLDLEADPAFVRLLDDPTTALGASTIPPLVRRRATDLADQLNLPLSQRLAIGKLVESNLLLVWGPPGTGKTHFLGLAVLCLAAAHAEARLPFRVLVSAFTHAAIDNCLRKIAELSSQHGLLPGGLRIAKLGRATLPDMGTVEEIPEAAAGNWLQSLPIGVAGGTAWAIRKGIAPDSVDLLMVDEGSQMKVPESAIPIRRLRPGGVLIVAGDDKQLPPIVQGIYPDPNEGEPILHRSIFESLRASDPSGDCSVMLLENFRMNETLCRYPAEQIYTANYQSATSEIGRRRLQLKASSQPDDLPSLLLDPAYPLVVGVLEGVRAGAENRIEAEMVADAACELRDRQADNVDDTNFWRHRLFIVCPHHAQIHAVRRALLARRRWNADPFVDTVDRMQGQECDAVIASYGVSDVEYAMQEANFIYSLNRLNVSITRARAKAIVFLPRPLIEPPIRAFEDVVVADGIAFMQGLVQFAERRGNTSLHELADGAGKLVLHRVAELA